MTIFIAEIGCNHQGNIELAKKMIKSLSNLKGGLKVDIVKFQKRTVKDILTKEQYISPHPDEKNSFGKTYGEHREFLEFNKEQHLELKEYCEAYNLEYSSSVFDINSAFEILELKPRHIKISAANNTDMELIKLLDDNFDGDIHISLGMTTKEEEKEIVNAYKKKRKNIILYACTTSYPVENKDICLKEITRLKDVWGREVKAIGLSGHHIGTVPDIAAMALGASYIERHYTIDKNLKGSDQFMSLDYDEYSTLLNNAKIVEEALCYKKTDILECEKPYRKRYR